MSNLKICTERRKPNENDENWVVLGTMRVTNTVYQLCTLKANFTKIIWSYRWKVVLWD